MGAKCEKQKVYSGVFRVPFLTFCDPFFAFAFQSISRQSRLSFEKSKDFVVYFFVTLTKHEMRIMYSECFIFRGVFCKNTRKMRNAKSVWPALEQFCDCEHVTVLSASQRMTYSFFFIPVTVNIAKQV